MENHFLDTVPETGEHNLTNSSDKSDESSFSLWSVYEENSNHSHDDEQVENSDESQHFLQMNGNEFSDDVTLYGSNEDKMDSLICDENEHMNDNLFETEEHYEFNMGESQQLLENNANEFSSCDDLTIPRDEEEMFIDQNVAGSSGTNERKLVTDDRIERNDTDSGESTFSESLAKIGRIANLKKSITETIDLPITKAGYERKKRLFKLSVKERAAKKTEYLQLKHGLRTACSHKACNEQIDKKRRQDINKEFWEMTLPERYNFGHGSIERKEVKRRKKNRVASRDNTYVYRLKKDNGEYAVVCKIFYLTTLGYAKSNDSFIKELMGTKNYKKPLPRRSKQGKHQKTPKKDRETIFKHIKSFNPVVSHHRRVHAPKRLYLPSEITIKLMHNHFLSKHPDYKCSYELYRNIVSNEMNISFTVLGNEECEDCEEYFNHKKIDPNCDTCSICESYKIHKTKYDEARQLYAKQRMLNSLLFAAYSLDLQKVIMLPRLDMFKTVIFCPRAIFFNESFVPLGGKKKDICQPAAMLWHEGISGRNAEDFVSAIYKFLLSKRDHVEIVLWLDNCSAQNKNWKLYSFLVWIMNSNEIATNKIFLNYFEPGHSFMSADSFHHQVELAMARKKKVYDFEDLKECVLDANSKNVTMHEMKLSDFFEWKDYSSKTKLQKATPRPYMKDMVQVTATRGCLNLAYKTSFNGEDIPLDFLLQNCKTRGMPKPEAKLKYRGITQERKLGIITKMRKVMIPNRLEFWKKMPVTDQESAIYGSDEEDVTDNNEKELEVNLYGSDESDGGSEGDSNEQ